MAQKHFFKTPFGCLTVLAFLLALMTILPAQQAWKRYSDSLKYSRQVFHPASAEPDDAVSGFHFRIRGTVQGTEEVLLLNEIPGQEHTADSASGAVSPELLESDIDVWYNPHVSPERRVLLYDPELFSSAKKDALTVTLSGFAPLLISLVFMTVITMLRRMQQMQSHG